MPILPTIGKKDSILRMSPVHLPTQQDGVVVLDSEDTPEIFRFARALRAIEAERVRIRERIRVSSLLATSTLYIFILKLFNHWTTFIFTQMSLRKFIE